MDRFYDAMAAEIETAGGTVEKFAGDAVMAAFGAHQRPTRTTSSGRSTPPFRCNGAWTSCSEARSRFGSA